jgi:hypothetical protein
LQISIAGKSIIGELIHGRSLSSMFSAQPHFLGCERKMQEELQEWWSFLQLLLLDWTVTFNCV